MNQNEIYKWVEKNCAIMNGSHSIDENGYINVYGDVVIFRKMKEIPVKFGIVTGNFNCINNKLTSLKGIPEKIRGKFYCDDYLKDTYEYKWWMIKKFLK
jgi:hypothetical protein